MSTHDPTTDESVYGLTPTDSEDGGRTEGPTWGRPSSYSRGRTTHSSDFVFLGSPGCEGSPSVQHRVHERCEVNRTVRRSTSEAKCRRSW